MDSIKNILIITSTVAILLGIGYAVKPSIQEYFNKEEKESESEE